MSELKTGSTSLFLGARSLIMCTILLFGVCSSYLVTATLLACSATLLFYHIQSKYNYWAVRGVKSPPATPFLGHTLQRLGIKMPFMEFFDDLYFNYNGRDFCGYYDFLQPGLFIGNPEIIKSILVKDFDHFADRRTFDLGKVNPIANDMLSNATGQHWRFIRGVVSPAFTSGKTRRLFPLMNNRAIHLLQLTREEAKKGSVEAHALCGKYTMDSIASCAFGIECDAYSSEAETFPVMAARVMQLSPARALKILVLLVAPKIAEVTQRLGIDFTSPEFHFFRHVVTNTLRLREKWGLRRGDILDMFLESNLNDKNGPSDNIITAQAILFILAGYNNTANTLALTLHLLAHHPDVQAELRREIAAEMERCGGQHIPHDRLVKMPYLDAVVSESLRLYPAAPVIERICTKPCTIAGTSIHLRKGQPVLIPIWSIHRDPQHWPQPTKFVPERFLGESKDSITPYSYLPFSHGPRSCIGIKFSLLSVKIGLVHLLTSMKLLVAKESRHPIALNPRVLTLQPKDGVFINFVPCSFEETLREETMLYPTNSDKDTNNM
ncbi:probable cytochrome P450 6a13 isoform X2 [Palaemon carinicauda]